MATSEEVQNQGSARVENDPIRPCPEIERESPLRELTKSHDEVIAEKTILFSSFADLWGRFKDIWI